MDTIPSAPPIHIQLAIRATADQVWQALVDGAVTPAYYMGFVAEYDLTVGAPYRYTVGGGDVITGTVTAVDAGRSLSTTFNGAWAPDVAELPESHVTFEIVDPLMPMPGVTILTCTHRGLPDGEMAGYLAAGWATILSGMKTLLETGAPMVGAPA